MKKSLLVACQPATSIPIASTPTNTNPPPVPAETPIPQPTSTSTQTPVPTIPASVVEMDGVQTEPGFSLIKFVDLYRPTGIAFDLQGRMYVISQDGNAYLLTDEENDGRADTRANFAVGFNFPLGVVVHPSSGDVYLSYQ